MREDIGDEGEDDGEPDEVDVEREKDYAEGQLAGTGRGGGGCGHDKPVTITAAAAYAKAEHGERAREVKNGARAGVEIGAGLQWSWAGEGLRWAG